MKTPDEISALVAEKVAGWKKHKDYSDDYPLMVNGSDKCHEANLPPYATSADAVLSLLAQTVLTQPHLNITAKMNPSEWIVNESERWTVIIEGSDMKEYIADAPTFPLAFCHAILRSKGVEVT